MLDPFLMPKKWTPSGTVRSLSDGTRRMETDFSAERDWYAWGGTGWQNGYCAVAQAYAMTEKLTRISEPVTILTQFMQIRKHIGSGNMPDRCNTFENP